MRPAGQLEKDVDRQNQFHREVIDNWYNSINIKTAKVVSFMMSKDERLQTRSALKEISHRFGIRCIPPEELLGGVEPLIPNDDNTFSNLLSMAVGGRSGAPLARLSRTQFALVLQMILLLAFNLVLLSLLSVLEKDSGKDPVSAIPAVRSYWL